MTLEERFTATRIVYGIRRQRWEVRLSWIAWIARNACEQRALRLGR